MSAYSLAAGLSGLLVSMVIDRFERKRALLWLFACFALATLACGLAPTYGALLTARVAAGVFGGVLGALVQVQESVFAGVWRVVHRRDGEVISDQLEVGRMPLACTAATAALTPPGCVTRSRAMSIT